MINRVVILVRALVPRIGERVLAGTGVRLASRKGIFQTFILRESIFRAKFFLYRGIAVLQRGSVVDLCQVGGGQHHRALGDFELAVSNHKLNVREVVARVREVRSFQPHLVDARVLAIRFRLAAEREVGFLVQRVADVGNLIARNRMILAVIRHAALAALDRHRHFVRDRRDFQRAFGLGDLVVRQLRVRVRLVGELVIARANHRLASRKGIVQTFAVRERLFCAKFFLYRGIAVRQRRAVVDLCQVGGGQHHRARVDYELAVFHNLKSYVLKVRIRVFEPSFRQIHRVGRRVSAFRFRNAVVREVICRVQRVADRRSVVAIDLVQLAVIGHAGRVALDFNKHFVRDRGDRQRTRNALDVVIVGDLALL